MAVSKIAVMALVGILAVPILLGYALNLDEVTETDYKPNGDPVNVTQMLQNNIGYSYAHGDANKLNFNAGSTPTSIGQPAYIFDSKSTNKTSIYALQQSGITPPNFELNGFYYIILSILNQDNSNRIDATLTYNDNTTLSIVSVKSVYYDDSTAKLNITHPDYIGGINYNNQYENVKSISFQKIGSYSGNYYGTWYYKTTGNNSQWVDISKGFHFIGSPTTDTRLRTWDVVLPDYTYSVLFTMNLDTITDANYAIRMNIGGIPYTLEKVTTNGVVNWSLYEEYHYPMEKITDLYYDSSRNDNTYQIICKLTPTGVYNSNDDEYYNYQIKFNYVGGWPTLMGSANVYKSYEWTTPTGTIIPYDNGLNAIAFNYKSSTGGQVPAGPVSRTPTIRIDDAYFRAFEYPIIENKEYSPSLFKDNPSTTIKDINLYGQSITFGGNTYTVDKDGNITLGTHKIPVNNLSFNSIPVQGGYENRIGNTTISTTVDPSTIIFNGKWGASVETIGQSSYSYTKTEWVAGQFAWNGMDTNFLIVGLITCLGVFVALGIYVRKSGKGMIPLLIVCGCCAGLFFCMI